jgi:serine/threonine protein kinase
VANRGTLGYAAPEMWSRMYGPVTDRSDVYSYGILVMEMVGEGRTLILTIKRVDQANSSMQSGLLSRWRRVSLEI